jgi:alanine racemase
MTHLANADDLLDTTTEQQLQLFREFVGNRSEPVSIANSAGVLGWKAAHGDWIRPGLMLYGVSPFPDKTGAQLALRAAMTLQSRLIAIKNLQVGQRVGYGGDWVCPADTRLGIIAIGYGDGYPRAAQVGAGVFLHQQHLRLIGRISMDMLAVDLSSCAQAQVGDTVELWGENLAVETVAKHAGTIPYTLLCNITRRVNIVDVADDGVFSEPPHPVPVANP